MENKKLETMRFINRSVGLMSEGIIEQDDLIKVIQISALMFPETIGGMKPIDDWDIKDCQKWFFDIMHGDEVSCEC